MSCVPDLSIIMITFNHEKYIKQALDSIFMQITQYSYEVIIGDDASSDATPQILMDYKKLYPDKIDLYLRTLNLGAKGANNFIDLASKCHGKYIITLEGDDFWIDKYKLEKEICYLETHKEYLAVAHNCIVVDEYSNMKNENYPECKDEEFTLKHMCSNILPGQFTTVMYRNIYQNNEIDCSLLYKGLVPTDRLIYFILASYGKIHCIQEPMSAYRHVISGGNSFSANYCWNYNEVKSWHLNLVEYSHSINNEQSIKFSELMLMKCIIGSRKRSDNSWFYIVKELSKMNFPISRYFDYALQLFKRKILKRELWG